MLKILHKWAAPFIQDKYSGYTAPNFFLKLKTFSITHDRSEYSDRNQRKV